MSEPVDYPKISIGGKEYYLRFGLKAVRKLKEWEVKSVVIGDPATATAEDLDNYWDYIIAHIAAGASILDENNMLVRANLDRDTVRHAYNDDPDTQQLLELGTAINIASNFLLPSVGAAPQTETAPIA